MGKLTDRHVKNASPGRHGDGDGLHLVVSATGRRTWLLRYQMNGVRRDMGLGSYPAVSLGDARLASADARKKIAVGVDPVSDRQAAKKAKVAAPTFQEIAALVIAEAQARSTNAKVRYQWERHLGPSFCGALVHRPVHEITTMEVAAELKKVWQTKPEVARKLYPAIRRVFDHARIVLRDQHNIDMGTNPASWSDLKALGFAAPTQLSRGRHPSLPYAQLPAFIVKLRSIEAVAARTLEFLILTNVRTGAVLNATWPDIDLSERLWTIPLESLKDRKYRTEGFRVPLSNRSVDILGEMQKVRSSPFVFPGARSGKPYSNMALLTLLRRIFSEDATKWLDPVRKRPITAHGFRASFRTWAEETSSFPHSVIEEAMGHQIGNAVERAYRRTDVLAQRRALMDEWARHCEALAEKAAQ